MGLFDKIMRRIDKEERLLILRRLAFFSVALLASITALVPSFRALQTGLAASGSLEFFSLLFSDLNLVAVYWRSFLMALLETLPMASLALFLATIFIFLGSLKNITRDVKIIYGF